MKNIFKYLALFLFIIFHFSVLAQNHADCVNAIPVCYNKLPIESSTGEGNYIDFQVTGPMMTCLLNERNSTYYYLACSADGNLGFEIQPGNTQTDYDWAVFDITTTGCSNFENYCLAGNIAINTGSTGPNGLGGQYCEGYSGQQYAPLIPVQNGHKYLIYVSNYYGTYLQDSIDFTFSDSVILPSTTTFTYQIDTCSSAPIELISGFGDSYQWSTGDTVSNIFVSSSGTYYVDYTNVCGTYTDTFLVNLITVPNKSFLPPDMSFCNQDSVIVFPTDTFSSYFWHYNNTTNMPHTLYTGGEYIVHALDTLGCTYFDTLNVYFSSEIYNPQICAASVNYSAAGIDLYYEVLPSWMPIQQYDIYKWDNLGMNFQLIATQFPPNAGYYFDAGAGIVEKETYYIIATDTCMNNNSDSIPDNSIFLEVSFQSPTSVLLNWSEPTNNNIQYYHIFKGDNPNMLAYSNSLSYGNSYSSTTVSAPTTYFQVRASFHPGANSLTDTIYSNIPDYVFGEDQYKPIRCKISPNPVLDCFSIDCEIEYQYILIYTSDGQIVKTMKKSSYYCIDDLETGVYYLQLAGGESKSRIRIIKE